MENLECNVWMEPDSKTGELYIKLSASLLFTEENQKWVASMGQQVLNKKINYINPLCSSNPKSTDEIVLGLHPISSSS